MEEAFAIDMESNVRIRGVCIKVVSWSGGWA
jgi:hypothetical protein